MTPAGSISDDVSYLIAVVQLERADRVFCQAIGCGHTIFRRVHIVLSGTTFKLVGSDCFRRLYGHLPEEQRMPHYGNASGIEMSEEERQLVANNTAEFVARLEAEDQRRQLLRENAMRLRNPHRDVDGYRVTADCPRVEGPLVSDKEALHYMWRRGVSALGAGISQKRIDCVDDPKAKAVLHYLVRGTWGDPWALAQYLLGRHGISHEFCLNVLKTYELVELLPAYSVSTGGKPC